MRFSKIQLKTERSDILGLDGLVSSPLLKIGITLACFGLEGSMAISAELFIMNDRG